MTNTNIPTFKLNDGTDIPSFGFGTFQILLMVQPIKRLKMF